VAQQAERAGRTRHRPLLHGADPAQRLGELMRVREPLYREIADLVVSTDHRRVAVVADFIAQRYRDALQPGGAARPTPALPADAAPSSSASAAAAADAGGRDQCRP